MASGIGTLSVWVQAHTGKAQKSLSGFRKSLDKTSKAAKSASKVFTAFGVALGGLSLAGVAMEIRQTMNEMDALAKTSAKLGIASEKLAGLRHAAEQTGVSISTLDMSLQRMTRRVSEASLGKGEAVDALRELGLNAGVLNRQRPDVVLGKVAEKLNSIENQSDKLRLAMKLFDSEGVALVNTLQLGQDGLSKMIADAKKLRIAPTEAELKKIEAANDAMDRAAKSIKGAFVELTTKLAPTIESAADSFSRKMTQVVDYWAGFFEQADLYSNRAAIANSNAPSARKEAAEQAALAAQKFRQMGMHDMADKAQAALDFQLGSWMNELGGMTFKDGQKKIQSLTQQANKTFEIWQASQQATTDAENDKAAEAARLARIELEYAEKWTAAINSMTGAANSFASRMSGMASALGLTGSVMSGTAAKMFTQAKRQERDDRIASLKSVMAGTREEYAMRAQMTNQGLAEDRRVQQEQLDTQQQMLDTQQQQTAATQETARMLGEFVGRTTAGFIGI